MKQYTKSLMKMNFEGLDMSLVAKIEFAFSQEIGQPPLKIAEYPTNDAGLMYGSTIGVVWWPEETALFKPDKVFYADTRITLRDSSYNPETSIIRLKMNPTLFEDGGEV